MMKNRNYQWIGLVIFGFGAGIALLFGGRETLFAKPKISPLSAFTTSLEGRTPGQRHNALWAARRLNGAIIAPGQEFSFNRRVGYWSREEGAVRAPVSFGGVLVPSWGGGVCQTSTTFYCASLLAGFEIAERHPHELAPRYVPSGMDAAVAYGVADLKIRNVRSFPIEIECVAVKDQLVCRLYALNQDRQRINTVLPAYRLERELVSLQTQPQLRSGLQPQTGRPGARVRLWRVRMIGGKPVRELCHESEYAPLPDSQ